MLQFGFCIPAESKQPERRSSWLDDIKRVLEMVKADFDSAWIVDHLMFDATDVLESFTTLSYFAALYPELHFGQAVICQSFRNPALLAKMAANLQFLTNGRYILGLGAGWHEAEYKAYGYEFPSNATRVAQLEESLQIIKALWTAEKATFSGQHYHIANASLEPKPKPLPPIMLGAFRPKMLALTARYADIWNVSSTSSKQYRQMNERFEQACAAIGRDVKTVKRSWIGGFACAPSEEEALRLTEGRWRADDEEDFGFVGTPEQILEQLQPFIELGVEEFIFDCGGFPATTSFEYFIRDVLPVLRSTRQ